jgi:hypothetical protein
VGRIDLAALTRIIVIVIFVSRGGVIFIVAGTRGVAEIIVIVCAFEPRRGAHRAFRF